MDTYVENTGAAEQEKQIQVVATENEKQIQVPIENAEIAGVILLKKTRWSGIAKARSRRKTLKSFEQNRRIRSGEKQQIRH